MGYGVGHTITLNPSDGAYVKYTGRNLRIVPDENMFESWDFSHPMDGMSNVKMSLLSLEFDLIRLSDSYREDLKEHFNLKRGEQIYFSWYKQPEGQIWSGYVRSAIKDSFPVKLRGTIDTGYLTFDVTIQLKASSVEEFKEFVEDVCDYYVTDEDVEAYAKEEEISIDSAREALYDMHNDDCTTNYRAE